LAKIILINANVTRKPYRVAPLGLAFIASHLKRKGHEVHCFEIPGRKSDYSVFVRKLLKLEADLVGIGIRNLDNSDYHGFEEYLQAPSDLVRELKQYICPPVIIGGSAGTVDANRVIEKVGGDCLVLGEGEAAFDEILARLERFEELPPVLDQKSEPFRFSQTYSLKPPALYSWFDMNPYLKGESGYPVQTKRGCPLRCSYCTYARIEGKRYRMMDPVSVVDEIERASNSGIRDFEFVDSTFNLPNRHAMRILEEIQRRQLRVNFVGTGVNPMNLPLSMLELMKEVGFQTLILSAESASERMLESYQKDFQVKVLYEAARNLDKAGIAAMWVFLLAGKGETRDSVEETLQFIHVNVREPHLAYITSGIRIYPGSPIGNEFEQGQLDTKSILWDRESKSTAFYYSENTPSAWLNKRLLEFQSTHTNIMLSEQGHSSAIELAQKVLSYLPVKKPYWRYLPLLNRIMKSAFSRNSGDAYESTKLYQ